MLGGKRVRVSLKTRDVQRAARRMAEMAEEALGRPRKTLTDAIDAFHIHGAHSNRPTLCSDKLSNSFRGSL